MLGQFQRGGAARDFEPEAELKLKQPPTERERAIAQRRAEGGTFHRIGKEFGLTPESVRGICRRVEDYDRGAAMLRKDPASIEALGLVGDVKPSVQQTLRARGIQQLTDLEGVTIDQLLRWPRLGKKSAPLLLDTLARLKRTD
jgi:DNA-binding CsgD family transcriptional regulator